MAPPIRNQRQPTVTKELLQSILSDNSVKIRSRAMLALLASTGMRVGELQALQLGPDPLNQNTVWDPNERMIRVRKSVYRGHPGIPGADIPERKYSHTMEYGVDGHVTVVRGRNSDGSEWVTRFTYDASGRLLKATEGKDGEVNQETTHSYDSLGRQLAIAESRAPDNPTTFRYDEHGRKTKVQISRPEDYRPNHMVAGAGSPFETADRAPNLPDGDSATTFYDADDRPTEVHVKNAHCGLITRAVIIYDAEGRVSEEKEILDNVETMFPEAYSTRCWKNPERRAKNYISRFQRSWAGGLDPSRLPTPTMPKTA
jgi:hypothetical protein